MLSEYNYPVEERNIVVIQISFGVCFYFYVFVYKSWQNDAVPSNKIRIVDLVKESRGNSFDSSYDTYEVSQFAIDYDFR